MYKELNRTIESLEQIRISAQKNDSPILSALLLINIDRLKQHRVSLRRTD